MITTTLNKIRNYGPCTEGWKTLLAHLGKTTADDEPLPLLTILKSNGLADTIWCLRSLPEHGSKWRHFAVDCAERVKHLVKDPRSLWALRVARLHADGLATDAELFQAWEAANAAATAATYANAANANAANAAASATAATAAYANAANAAYAAAATAAYANSANADAAATAAAYANAANAAAYANVYSASDRTWQANRLKWYIS